MEIIKEDVFRRQIKSGLCGGYLFFGEEDYLKAHALRTAREALCPDPSFAFFNDMRIDAPDYSAQGLLDALMPLPIMSDQKLVSVTNLYLSSLKASELDDLCDALATLGEYDYNVLILCVPADGMDEGSLPKRPSALLKRLSQYLTPVRFESISPARLCSWAGKHFAHSGVQASGEACAFLVRYCGTSMYTLASEIEKLCAYVLSHGRQTVSEADIRHVCIPQINDDAFGLANAILDGKYDEALSALSVMKFRRVEPVVILGEVSRVCCDLLCVKLLLDEGHSQAEIASILKMNEYRLRIYAAAAAAKTRKRLERAIALCRNADTTVKGGSGYAAIENLICSLS